MSNEIALTGDMRTLVVNKLRDMFAELIPEKTLEKAIEEEFKKFFVVPVEISVERGWKSCREGPRLTPFESIIREEIRALLVERMQEKVRREVDQVSFDELLLEGLIREAAPLIWRDLVQTMIKGFLERNEYTLRNDLEAILRVR